MKLKELDWKTRKLMTMYRVQHPNADAGRLYLQGCAGGRSLIGLEDYAQVEVRSFEKYLNTSKDKILTDVRRSQTMETNKYGRSKEEIHKEH